MYDELKNYLKQSGKSDEEITEAIELEEDLKRRIQAHHLNVNRLEKEYKENLANAVTELRTIRQLCQHYETHYCLDPSGNNDSSYICDLCGKESRRRENLGGIWTN